MENRLRSRHSAAMLGVELHLRPHPAVPHAFGAAEGNHVFLNLYDDFLGSERSLHLLRHEMRHVLQQRHGRVDPAELVHGHAVNREAALEIEAEECAMNEVFASRTLDELAATRGVQPPSPVLQCFTRVAEKTIYDPRELSSKAQVILEMIPSGELWLRRMGAAGQQYVYDSEAEFLVGIQQGLHGTQTVVLPTLRLTVSPHVLYAMHLHELERIQAVEQRPDEKNFDLHIRTTLIRQKLWSEAELDVGDHFLKHYGVIHHPCLASRGLADRVAVFELINDASTAITLNTMLQQEAASFAVTQAQSALEFVDYYKFFMAQIKESEPPQKAAPLRLRSAETLSHLLTPILFDYLWCPQFDAPPTTEELPWKLKAWSSQGYRLGFPRVSAALANVAQFAGLEGATGKAAIEIINRYMDRIQALWLDRTPNRMRYSQSGSHLEYLYQMPQGIVSLQLAADGSLTIGSYEPETHYIAGSTSTDRTQTT